MKKLISALLAISLSQLVSAAEPPPERFEDVRARSRQMGETEEGKAYQKRISELFAKPMQAALQACTKGAQPPFTVNIVFVISADGTTRHIVSAPDQPVSACVAKKLNGLKLPVLPKPDWMIGVEIAIKE